jgi:hypothetical protein
MNLMKKINMDILQVELGITFTLMEVATRLKNFTGTIFEVIELQENRNLVCAMYNNVHRN